ncbi:MAG: phospholipid methyltransferase [Sneathiella sp.]|uniref:class I SAM-dependent methyltransferase n=1 Tax=Sneathiella sp. TaxID=1964365 RepID=UPI000C54DC41|nr:methyltransferase domain-containing protein [Sneathiella sp.]MAZ01541.1 phospholipid methyltransferase [Sneathiella sp.]
MYQPFVLALLRNPRQVGAVAPSGPLLARAMADAAEPAGKRILEIGPGTGVITEALLDRGAPRDELYLLERDVTLAAFLGRKFPDINIIVGDARTISNLISPDHAGNFDVIVSSLPLLNMKEADKVSILKQFFTLLGPDGALIQYTYSARAPIAPALATRCGLRGTRMSTVFRNLPPARVWKYDRDQGPIGQ